ncbi:MAG: hypothetical protein ACFB16_15770 [Phormidesmis sp.]
MPLSFQNSPSAVRMLQRMSPALRESFTTEQLEAIENALVPRTHLVDLRCLIPLFGKGAYFVLVCGPNRRQQPRLSNGIEQLTSHTTGHTTGHNTGRTATDTTTINTLETESSTPTRRCYRYPTAYRVLDRMPTSVSSTFTQAQIHAIENALAPRQHLIDIRRSLPFLGKGAYLVFAAGPNRRARYHSLQNRNPFVMPTVASSIALGAAIILGLVQLSGSAILAELDPVFQADESFHPTAVPFKKNRGECEKSGRQWINEQCIDKVHDPVF